MSGGKIVRWIALGLDEHGKFVGLFPIRITTPGELTNHLKTEQALLTLKERSLTSTPTVSRSDKLTTPKNSVEYFHGYFQKKMAATFGGYPGLSAKDRENWLQLLSGFQPDLLVLMIDAVVGQHASALEEIDRLPHVSPTVGILRGWSADIAAWVTGKHPKRSVNVRNFSQPAKIKEGKF